MCMPAELASHSAGTRSVRASAGFYPPRRVVHYSPGLQPWVSRTKSHALKVASEVVRFALGVGSVDGARCLNDDWNENVTAVNTLFGRHFQGASPKPRNPGLKPWAVLFLPFQGTEFP
jgi:hypothetical protein